MKGIATNIIAPATSLIMSFALRANAAYYVYTIKILSFDRKKVGNRVKKKNYLSASQPGKFKNL